MSDKSKIFSRGYKISRDKLSSNPYYLRSCFNCKYYFQASGDKEEVCQNQNVLQYDMVVTENNVYCVLWKQSSKNEDTMFKKSGRSILDD